MGKRPPQNAGYPPRDFYTDARDPYSRVAESRTNARRPAAPQYGARTESRQQYDPRMQSRQQYDPRMQSRQQYDPRMQNRQQYDPRMQNRQQYDPRMPNRQQYDPRMPNRQQYDPRMQSRQQYDPRMQSRGQYDARYGSRGYDSRYNTPPRRASNDPYTAELRRRERAERERRRAAERERLRRLELELKKAKRARRRQLRRIFFGRAAVTGVIFLILASMLCGILALNFNYTPDRAPTSISYVFGGAKKYVRKVSSSTAMKDGHVMISFNDIADYLELYVIGDSDGMKYVFPSDGIGSEGTGREDTVKFINSSRTAYINSREITLDCENRLVGEEMWVSLSFAEQYLKQLDIVCSDGKVEVARLEDPELSTKKEPVYLEVSLSLKSEAELASLSDPSQNENSSTVREPVVFTTDLSAYEKYMAPENEEEYLTLVNASSTLDSSFVPEDLVNITATRNDGRETQMMRASAAYALEALFLEMEAAGFSDVSVTSGYRSYESQLALHEQYINDEMTRDPSLDRDAAKALVLTYSSAPGTSEHQSGLCVDMHNLLSADVSYAETESYKWLTENAWKFGYILRYPEDKTDVTGISFEPWHWRFVGRENARAMRERALCLEEYVMTTEDAGD